MRDYDSDDEDVSVSEELSNSDDAPHACTHVTLRSKCSKISSKNFKVQLGEGTSHNPRNSQEVKLEYHVTMSTWIPMVLVSLELIYRQRGMHFDSLKVGLRIPFDPFLVDFVNYYGIVPAQIAPNAHRILACYPQICKRHQVPCTLELFNFLHLGEGGTGGFVGGGEREGTVVVKVASVGLECWTGGLGGAGELVMVAAADVWECGCCCLGVTARVTYEVWAPTIAVVAAGLPDEVLKIEED
nr:Bromodomain adjacent to zinc finger domain 1A [Ipomoea batatas]